jgi:hypothetical protein
VLFWIRVFKHRQPASRLNRLLQDNGRFKDVMLNFERLRGNLWEINGILSLQGNSRASRADAISTLPVVDGQIESRPARGMGVTFDSDHLRMCKEACSEIRQQYEQIRTEGQRRQPLILIPKRAARMR